MTDAEFHASSPEEVRRLRDGLHARGQKLVFTNGCFDLLHAGHVRYLNQARALGDALVVALNSDRSVRELKGPNRPVNTENDRAEVMAALRAVDAVVIFSDSRATELIKAIHPHVYVKGGDYTVDSLNPEEKAALDAVGAEIQILPLVPGRSTTKTLQRAAQPEQGKERKLRIGVLGSGKGSNFQAILSAIKTGQLEAEVAVAISDQADSGFLKIARASRLHAQAVDGGPGSRLSDSAQKEICEHLQRANVEVVVLTGFMRILKEPLLSAYSGRIVNVHPSLLPLYKGANAPALAIADGAKQTGCTVHLVTAEIDGGAILAQSTVPVLPGDTPEVLHERIKGEEHKLLPRVLAEWRQQ